MKTEILPFDLPEAQKIALGLLRTDQIIAAPTDTVYGLMCRYDSVPAISRLYDLKSRPRHKAIPVLIGAIEQLKLVTAPPLPSLAKLLIDNFWPGPLTIVLPAHPTLPAMLTAGNSTVAVRMPAHDRLLSLLQRSGPLAATSANHSGHPEAHSAAEVARQLPDQLPLILDEKALHTVDEGSHLPSTIVQITENDAEVTLLRLGPIADRVRMLLNQAASNTVIHAAWD